MDKPGNDRAQESRLSTPKLRLEPGTENMMKQNAAKSQ
jgi:hypothetical protein